MGLNMLMIVCVFLCIVVAANSQQISESLCKQHIENLGAAWLSKDANRLADLYETARLFLSGIQISNAQTTASFYRTILFPVVVLSSYSTLTVLPTNSAGYNCSFKVATSATNVITGQTVGGIPDGQQIQFLSFRPDGTIDVFEKVYLDEVSKAITRWVNGVGKRDNNENIVFV